MTTPAPIRQAEIERMMRAVRKVNRCEAVGVEIVNGTLRAIPVIPAVNTQAEREALSVFSELAKRQRRLDPELEAAIFTNPEQLYEA